MNSIGKWNVENKTESVIQHLRDTGDVMKHLVSTIVPRQTIQATGIDLDDFAKIAEFCARVHDIGKCTPAFQYKTPMGECRCDSYDTEMAEKSPHALAGAAILSCVYSVPMSVCEIIASHHGQTMEKGKDPQPKTQFGKFSMNYGLVNGISPYREEWDEIYYEAVSHTGISNFPELSIQAQFLISGLIIMADWISSNEEYFPIENAEDQESRADNALIKLDIPPMWNPSYSNIDDDTFFQQFGFYPNELQKACNRIAFENNDIGLMIIESTMGTGKTEAGLSAGEIMGFNAGSGGLYFGLPTRATANAILPRITEWIRRMAEGERVSLRLAHGEAFHNAYYKDLQINDTDGISINKWLSGRHRALLPDFVVGTVDQLLTAGLVQKFVMLLHLGLAGKVIIIDEVHSYDTYMSTYMESVLSWLRSYGAPVILLSATLTNEKKNALVYAYTGRKDDVKTDVYPCITWADKNHTVVTPVELDIPEKNVKIIRITEEKVCETAVQAAKAGSCVGVIVNRVKDAQQLTAKIRSMYEGKGILLHSRFLPKDRSEIEDEIIKYTGKKSTDELRRGTLVIGTQVLEQSLDIDYDVIISEECPMDLLIQRIGRLHRHSVHDTSRPDEYKSPVCYVFESKGKQIYDKYIIRRTEETLPDHIVLPKDIRPLIEEVYDLSEGTDGIDKREFEKKQYDMNTMADAHKLSSPEKYDKFKLDIDPHISCEGVRYNMNTMQIILLQKNTRGNIQTLNGNIIPEIPNASELALISEQKINRYYDNGLQKYLSEQKLPEWTKYFNECFLILDENGCARTNDKTFRYTKIYGLEENV